MNLQAPEILIILVVVLLLFGAKKVPELARSVGQAQREFKKGANDAAAPAPAPAAPVDAAESTAA
jgi:sec-independent protein translocase protein TatA